MTKKLFLITEHEVVTLTLNEATLPIENKIKFYERIILSITLLKNILIENIQFLKITYFLKLAPCM